MAGPSRLKPGEKSGILVKVTTEGRSGPLAENVEVQSNDPARPEITLTLRAYIMDLALPFSEQSPGNNPFAIK
jgi:hypothetical protein